MMQGESNADVVEAMRNACRDLATPEDSQAFIDKWSDYEWVEGDLVGPQDFPLLASDCDEVVDWLVTMNGGDAYAPIACSIVGEGDADQPYPDSPGFFTFEEIIGTGERSMSTNLHTICSDRRLDLDEQRERKLLTNYGCCSTSVGFTVFRAADTADCGKAAKDMSAAEKKAAKEAKNGKGPSNSCYKHDICLHKCKDENHYNCGCWEGCDKHLAWSVAKSYCKWWDYECKYFRAMVSYFMNSYDENEWKFTPNGCKWV